MYKPNVTQFLTLSRTRHREPRNQRSLMDTAPSQRGHNIGTAALDVCVRGWKCTLLVEHGDERGLVGAAWSCTIHL